ncbi:hypothetical protein SS50377_23892 [Spironucleus salmonicida]|uniref:Uncharacterized protein n=1 Tax=Spironucleus salmonicida TaxID=348837 RepID=V6LUW9_9EUKA|nr:hypothetical protein SS50377_23878 [Spironucleus salmonicida]KAH0573957.1 hypothetical protein SS50377_23892 [Spironucleus salmonicida]|eukprot:EST48370.1 Hypothetical protein SS50377_11469 [Spironucleus salmonicida]
MRQRRLHALQQKKITQILPPAPLEDFFATVIDMQPEHIFSSSSHNKDSMISLEQQPCMMGCVSQTSCIDEDLTL